MQPSKCMRTDLIDQFPPLPGRRIFSGNIRLEFALEASGTSWEIYLSMPPLRNDLRPCTVYQRLGTSGPWPMSDHHRRVKRSRLPQSISLTLRHAKTYEFVGGVQARPRAKIRISREKSTTCPRRNRAFLAADICYRRTPRYPTAGIDARNKADSAAETADAESQALFNPSSRHSRIATESPSRHPNLLPTYHVFPRSRRVWFRARSRRVLS